MRDHSVIALVAVAVMAATTAVAFPFSKSSGVVELSPKTLPAFLNTHKPVYLMFYAPWCGHCKSMHPDWEKFGKGMNDVVRVGAVNADQHREIGGQYGVKGFPTIKYWGMGDKKGKAPQDYQGQRTHGALHNAALREISASGVSTATSLDTVTKAMDKASEGKVVILFSNKNKSPPLFSVMAQSKHFKGKVGFVLATEKAKNVATEFDVTSFPTIMVVSKDADGGFAKELYSGDIGYTPIAKFLQKSLGMDVAEEAAAGGDGKKKAAGDAKKDAADGDASEKAAEKPRAAPKVAAPVRPLELTTESFKTHCAHGATKKRGQQPFCVISFTKDNFPLEEVHNAYANEAVNFFWIPDAARSTWMQDFEDGLQPSHNRFAPEDVVVLRAAKDRTKFTVWRNVPNTEHGHPGQFDPFLARCLGGDTTFDRNPGFPTLREVQSE